MSGSRKLHEIAAGSMDIERRTRSTTWRRRTGTTSATAIGEMTGLDRERREVHVAPFIDDDGDAGHAAARRSATTRWSSPSAACSNDFGTPGVARARDRARDRRPRPSASTARLVNACIRAHAQTEPLRPEQLHVAIIGAGATGVELAAELHNTTRAARGLRPRPHRSRQGHPGQPDRGAPTASCRRCRSACRRPRGELLAELGVSVRTSARGRRGAARRRAARRAATCIPAELVVWAAGVKAPDFLQGHRRARDQPHQPARRAADAADDARRRHLRDRRLRRLPVARARQGAVVPPRAQAAHQQASHMVKQIRRRLRGQAAAAVALSRFRLAGVARRVLAPSAT